MAAVFCGIGEMIMEAADSLKLGPLQKCPYHKSILVWVFRWGMMVLGTVGLIFLNPWVALLYFLYTFVFTFWAWPIKHCKNCYYSVVRMEEKNGKPVKMLLPLNEWKESHLKKHVDCGKKLFPPLGFLLWILPIVLMGISLLWNFSVISLFSLIGFMVLLAVMLLYVRWKVCPTCVIVDECHAAF
jgi:hypothetical protein